MQLYLISTTILILIGIYLILVKSQGKNKSLQEELIIVRSKQVLCSKTKVELQHKISELEVSLQRVEESSLEFYNRELLALNDKLGAFEASTSSVPLPVWFKDLSGILIYANKEYEKMFLSPRGYSLVDYIGYTDFNVWPYDVAQGFKINDDLVCESEKPYRSIEELQDEHGATYYVEVLKYPRLQDDKLTGVSGIVLRVAEFKDDLDIYKNGK